MFFARRTTPVERAYATGSIRITDPDVRERIAFIGLTEADLGVIATWREASSGALEHLVDEFYAHINGTTETRTILETHSSIARQRPMLMRYVATMLDGRLDDAYVTGRRHVGAVHDRIDLDSNWYVGMYEVIRRVLDDAVRGAGANAPELHRFSAALSRLIQVDIALVITALTDSRRARIEAEHRAAGEFVGSVGSVLQKVADRDLTARFIGDVPPQYTAVVEALEGALGNLQQALQEVAGSANQVAGAAASIDASSGALSSAAMDQSTAVEEVSATLHQVAAQSAQAAASAAEASQLSAESASAVAKGEARMRDLQRAIAQIDETSARMAAIVKSIDSIAFQTNLLSLNAAVEAARAGDAGRGFAVVADEVRALALRSAEAARDTNALIDEARTQSSVGVALGRDVSEHLVSVDGMVRRVHEVMGSLAGAADQQRESVAEITRAMSQIGRATQSVAAGAEESAAASAQLNAQARSMESMLADFTLAEAARLGTSHGAPDATLSSAAPAKRGSAGAWRSRTAPAAERAGTIHRADARPTSAIRG